MTAEDFIAANPEHDWMPRKIGRRNGLEGLASDGSIVWAILKGEHHVSGPGPWSAEQIRAAKDNLDGAQLGKEFATVAADSYARAVRKGGLTVVADGNGVPRIVFKGALA